MKKSLKIYSKFKSYYVRIGTKFSLKNHKNTLFIVDDYFKSHNKHNFVHVKANEKNKSYKNIEKLIKNILLKKINRDYVIVSVGGGIIQDISCFVSSIYFRGINWIYYPTTLLGMVDSCIGGKSSINIENYKNILGTYNPPLKIIVDYNFLKTLNSSQLAEGIIEAIKILYASNNLKKVNFFLNKLLNEKIVDIKKKYYHKLIYWSLYSKKKNN